MTSYINNTTTTWPNPSKEHLEKQLLKKSSFKRTLIKGMGQRYYYQYKGPLAEVCLEPCIRGFDVALYQPTSNVLVARSGKEPELIYSKKCTNINLGDEYFKKDLHKTQPRPKKVWEKALKIANEMYNTYRKELILKKWKLTQSKETEGDTITVDPDAYKIDRTSYPTYFSDGNTNLYRKTDSNTA